MKRDLLDLLSNPNSKAGGMRRPGWLLAYVAYEESANVASYDDLIERLRIRPDFNDARGNLTKDVGKTLVKLRKLQKQANASGSQWIEERRRLHGSLHEVPKWLRDEVLVHECLAASGPLDFYNRLWRRPELTDADGRFTDDARKDFDVWKKLCRGERDLQARWARARSASGP